MSGPRERAAELREDIARLNAEAHMWQALTETARAVRERFGPNITQTQMNEAMGLGNQRPEPLPGMTCEVCGERVFHLEPDTGVDVCTKCYGDLIKQPAAPVRRTLWQRFGRWR